MGRQFVNGNDILQGVTSIYIETAPLIYYVEENPRYLAPMDTIINAIEQSNLVAMSSVITLTEVLSHPIKLGNHRLEQQYQDILVNGESFQLISVNIQIAQEAARLRARYGLRTPDAIHVASALYAQCQAFLTNDKAITKVNELRVLLLDELID